MTLLAAITTATLTLIALLHAAWAFGVVWPKSSEEDLARTVVGRKGITRMPGTAISLLVAVLLFAIGLWPLWRIGVLQSPLPDALSTAAGWCCMCVFAVRGVIGYSPQWRSAMSEEPFASLDQRIYSPLCLLLAGSFLALLTIGAPQ